MKINLINDQSQQTKQAKVGFSWTTLFFGFFPAVFREDWKWAAIFFLIEMVFTVGTFGFGFSIPGIICSFFYNRLYINDLIKKGFRPADDYSANILKQKGFNF